MQTERRFRRKLTLLTAVGSAAAVLMALLLLSLAGASAGVHAQGNKTLDVIIQFDDSDTVIRPISFTEKISGLIALEKTGLDIETMDTQYGTAICSIAGVGCPAENCFCDTKYWGYNYWDGNAWVGYSVGADSSMITETDSVEGWRWGEFGEAVLPPTGPQAAQAALDWVRSKQSANGGFGGIGASVEAAFAVGANREAAAEWRAAPDKPSLADFLFAYAANFADDNSAASGKIAVAAAASDFCWPDGVLSPADYYSPTLGAYSQHMGFHIWGVLGAVAAGDPIAPDAVRTIKEGAQGNGGWKWMENEPIDTNTTALAIQALVAAGEPMTATEIISGLAFIKSTQNEDGGVPLNPTSAETTESDTNSTAYLIQALYAAGQNPAASEWTTTEGHTPIDFILGLQLSDGSFEWQKGTGSLGLATVQAVSALLGKPYPIALDVDQCPALYLPDMISD